MDKRHTSIVPHKEESKIVVIFAEGFNKPKHIKSKEYDLSIPLTSFSIGMDSVQWVNQGKLPD